jgi:hypothetical protein
MVTVATVTGTISKEATKALKAAADAEGKALAAREAADDVALAQLQARDDAALKARLTEASEEASHTPAAELKDRFTAAHDAYGEAENKRKAMQQLALVSRVEMARAAFSASVHPDVTGKAGSQNTSAAARHFDMPIPSIRPYVMAGAALYLSDRGGLLSAPEAEDIAIVEGSFDRHSRADQAAKRLKAAKTLKALTDKHAADAARAEAAEAEAARLAAELAAANGGTPEGAEGAEGTPEGAEGVEGAEGATEGAEGTPEAEGAEAPDIRDRIGAEMDSALAGKPEGSSVTDDILKDAKRLVKACMAQREMDNAEWQKTYAKLVPILKDVFRNLKA